MRLYNCMLYWIYHWIVHILNCKELLRFIGFLDAIRYPMGKKNEMEKSLYYIHGWAWSDLLNWADIRHFLGPSGPINLAWETFHGTGLFTDDWEVGAFRNP